MIPAASDDRWPQARAALRSTGKRFQSLVLSNPTPEIMATEDWTVADTAAHLVTIASLYVSFLGDGTEALQVPGLEHALATTNVDTVAHLNRYVMEHFSERDPQVLAGMLDRGVEQILAATEHADPATPITWLGGSRVPIGGLVAHLVNELLIHGWDVARVLRRPWRMPEADAALFWELFFVGMVRHDHGMLLDTGVRRPRRPIAVQFRSAFTSTVTLVLDGDRVRVVPPGDPVDARITFRPAQFNLMLFGRISPVRAAARRDVIVGGPRPWRLPAFLRVVHVPNSRVASGRGPEGPGAA